MAIAMELGQMDHAHAHVLEHPDEIGRRAGRASGFFFRAAMVMAMWKWLVRV